ncbi:MAG: amidase [Acidimicrobiia bacterium]|nr:amidase [Acidimicrobiia bacterium]
MTFSDYDSHDALGLAELVRNGEVSSLELVDEAIVRIEANGQLNAVIARRFEEARDRAAGDLGHGPFAGVPWLIKDLATEEGQPVTFGSVFFRDFISPVTSEIVSRHHQAGFIPLGRTTSPEFGLLPTTESKLFGATRNPWSLEHSTGGSSGGAAAAVASRIVPMAHASDGGGSIRIPAANCGVFGLKISRGINPQAPSPNLEGLGVDHCVSLSVRDSAALLDATRGPVPGDPWWAPEPERPYLSEVGADPGRLRIGFSFTDFRGIRAHPDNEHAVTETAGLLERLGHNVEEAKPDLDGDAFAEAFLLLWATIPAGIDRLILDGISDRRGGSAIQKALGGQMTLRMARALEGRRAGMPAFEGFTRSLVKLAEKKSPADVWHARVVLQRQVYRLAEFFSSYDLLLTPVLGSPPVRIGEIDPEGDFEELVERLYRYVSYTPVANVGGNPAMSVPLHWNRDGLPIGVQFTAPFVGDALLLRLAAQLEEARPWRDKRPPAAVTG